MNRKKILIFGASLFVAYSLFAQTADDAYALYKAGNDCFNAGDYDSAISYYAKAVPLYEGVYGKNHLYTADVYFFLGLSYSRMGNHKDAVSWLEKSLAIYDSPQGDISSAANAYYEIGKAFYDKAEYDRALQCYKKALAIRQTTAGAHKKNEAILYSAIGLAYEFKANYNEAIANFKKALAIREKLFGKESLEVASSLRDLGGQYFWLGNYESALDYLERTLEIQERILGTESAEVAQTCSNIMSVYIDMGFYEDALEWNEKVLDIFSSIHYESSFGYGVLCMEQGRCYQELGDFAKALRCYSQSLDLLKEANEVDSSPYIAKAYANIGHAYQGMGDYNRALSNLEESLKIHKSMFGDKHLDIADCYLGIGYVYASMENFDMAISYFNQAAKQFVNILGESHQRVAETYEAIGNMYSSKHEYEQALAHYRKALAIVSEVFGPESFKVAGIYDKIATVYQVFESAQDDAIELAKAALDLYRNKFGEKNSKTAIQYASLGLAYVGAGKTEDAVACFGKSFAGFRSSSNYQQILITLKSIVTYSKLFSLADYPSFISETLDCAADTVERARLDLTSIKSDILRESLPIYYYGVDFEARHGNPEKAFEYAEMLRSRGFLDEVGLERALSLDGVTDEERKQIKEMSAQVAFARKEIENQNSLEMRDRDEKKLAQAEKRLTSAEKSLAKLDNAIGKRIPQYAQLRNPRTVSAKSAQKWCGNDRAILEYVFQNQDVTAGGDSESGQPAELKSYCLVVTRQNVTAIPLDDGFDYAAAVTKLRESIIPRNALAKPTPESVFETERNSLYEKLIEPALPYIKGKNRLVIVPDGSLAFLPFDVLRKNEHTKMLCEQYAVSLSPSISVSMIVNESRAKEVSMLAFGGAWYDSEVSVEEHRRTFSESDASRGRKRGFQAMSLDLNIENEAQKAFILQDIQNNGPSEYFRQKKLRWMDLPGTITELNALKSAVFKGKGYEQCVQEAASEQTVKQLSKNGNLATYPVLHFACHGYFDKSLAVMSSILFSEISGKLDGVSSEDGYLTIPEVSLLNLDADLVCLSACETGLGEIRVGDGMIGLNRAFMVAGARRVGVTLWNVDDEATAEFMASMYKKVERYGMDYEQAYRRTKAEFQKSEYYSHPYYWAAFSLYE